MCVALPGTVVQVDGVTGVVDIAGTHRDVCFAFLPGAAVGDQVLVHAGLAIAALDQREAEQALDLLTEIDDWS